MPAKRLHPGFTLIELLVVIVLIITLVGIAFPTITSLVRSSKGDTAVNTVSVAAQAIRAYATQSNIGSGKATVQKTNTPVLTQLVDRQGTALLFTPSGEIRLTQHNPNAYDSSITATANVNEKQLLILKDYAPMALVGYMDIANRDPIKLPTGIGALGIIRDTTSGGALKLISPPFTVRFNSYGQLVAGDRGDDTTYAYYDGDYNGKYLTNSFTNSRPPNYNPKDYDPYYNTTPTNVFDTNKRQYKLPFDKIETVIGVVLYNKADLDSANLGSTPLQGTVLPNATQDWIFKPDGNGRFENAKVVFFNRYTGQAIREGVTGQ